MKKFICLMATLAGVVAATGVQADNFYAGGFGGFNWRTGQHHNSNNQVGYALGLDAGYKWCNGFRTEVEFDYRHNRGHRHHDSSDTTSHHRRAHSSYAGLFNVLYDFDEWGCWCVVPYVGAGVGGGSERRNHHNHTVADSLVGGSSHHHNKDRASFVWQIIAGVAYPLNDCVDLDLSYRYFKFSKENRINNHTLVLGVNYKFY